MRMGIRLLILSTVNKSRFTSKSNSFTFFKNKREKLKNNKLNCIDTARGDEHIFEFKINECVNFLEENGFSVQRIAIFNFLGFFLFYPLISLVNLSTKSSLLRGTFLILDKSIALCNVGGLVSKPNT